MRVIKEPLIDKDQTVGRIYELIDQYHSDLKSIQGPRGVLARYDLDSYFNFVRKLPYAIDKKPIEVVGRPLRIVERARIGIDCKKKAILMGSWCKSNGIPFRMITSSNRKDKRVHHIFPQAKIDGAWRNIDATYSHYRLFEPKTVTYAEVF
jgi:hypothetical protein